MYLASQLHKASHLMILALCLHSVLAGDYRVWIGAVTIAKTRSAHYDTLIGAMAVNGTVGVQPLSMSKMLGQYGGPNSVTFYPDGFEIRFAAPDDAQVEIVYTLLNKGNIAGGDPHSESA
jgi:hypothetical protein